MKTFSIPVTVIDGVQYVSIADFAKITRKTVPAIRYLFLNGNAIRPLHGRRMGRSIYIRLDEFYIYPFLPGGRPEIHKSVYHYDDTGHHICTDCTDGQRCPLVNDDGDYIHTKKGTIDNMHITVEVDESQSM